MHFPYQINGTSTKKIEERDFEKELITNEFWHRHLTLKATLICTRKIWAYENTKIKDVFGSFLYSLLLHSNSMNFIQILWILFSKHMILSCPPVVNKNFIFPIFRESLKSLVVKSYISSLENKIWDSLLFQVKSVEIKFLKIVKKVFLEKLLYIINIKHDT